MWAVVGSAPLSPVALCPKIGEDRREVAPPRSVAIGDSARLGLEPRPNRAATRTKAGSRHLGGGPRRSPKRFRLGVFAVRACLSTCGGGMEGCELAVSKVRHDKHGLRVPSAGRKCERRESTHQQRSHRRNATIEGSAAISDHWTSSPAERHRTTTARLKHRAADLRQT